MTENTITIKKGTVKKIMKQHGRTADNAVAAMHEFLNAFIVKVINESIDAQKHAGRKTINAEDIAFVTKKYLSE